MCCPKAIEQLSVNEIPLTNNRQMHAYLYLACIDVEQQALRQTCNVEATTRSRRQPQLLLQIKQCALVEPTQRASETVTGAPSGLIMMHLLYKQLRVRVRLLAGA